MKLKDFNLGFSDAKNELLRKPEILINCFYDNNNILGKLLDGDKYILLGTKGVGKSAYNAKIQLETENNPKMYVSSLELNDFDFSLFFKTSVDSNFKGGKQFKDPWDFLLLHMIYKVIYCDMQITEIPQVNDVINHLEKNGLGLELKSKEIVKKLKSFKLGKGLELQFELLNEDEKFEYSTLIKHSIDNMLEALSYIDFNDRNLKILLDGLDDILRFKRDHIQILTSLIRSTDYLNTNFLKNKTPIKIILFIRQDIFSLLIDPDLNKIKRDWSEYLKWTDKIDDLKKLVELRLSSSDKNKKYDTYWDKIFPTLIQERDSWEYILEHTLIKPRDILQFLLTCQYLFPESTLLTFKEINTALKDYSSEYFIHEMKNELSGFIDDKLIQELEQVFQRIGNNKFSYNKFSDLLKESNSKIDESIIKDILLRLFESGYIGHLQTNSRNKKQSVLFKHRNPGIKIDYKEYFIIHKGLHKALGVRSD